MVIPVALIDQLATNDDRCFGWNGTLVAQIELRRDCRGAGWPEEICGNADPLIDPTGPDPPVHDAAHASIHRGNLVDGLDRLLSDAREGHGKAVGALLTAPETL